MKKEPMSIGTQMFWGKIFVGCTWIGSGVFGIFDNLVCDILHIICLLSAIIVMVVLMRVDLEEDDEMAEYNYTKANAKTTRYMHIVYCVCSVLSAVVGGLLKDAGIPWHRVIPELFFLLMGIQNIITGVIFRKLEAE